MDSTPSEPSNEEASAADLTNVGRLRTHLATDGLAIALLAAWKKDDPESQGKMLTALNNFFKPEQ
jgi:hypothetical protein